MALGIMAMTLHHAAYMSEIIRVGIESVPRGQVEGAKACGMNYGQRLRYVVLPQATLPPLLGQTAVLIKDTSLLSLITVFELVAAGVQMNSERIVPNELPDHRRGLSADLRRHAAAVARRQPVAGRPGLEREVSMLESYLSTAGVVLPFLLKGFWETLKISFFAIIAGSLLGFVIGVVRSYRIRGLHQLLGLYIHVLRGTPFLVQLYIFYFVLPSSGIAWLHWDSATAALRVAVGLHVCYVAEIIRGAIEAVPRPDRGRHDAGPETLADPAARDPAAGVAADRAAHERGVRHADQEHGHSVRGRHHRADAPGRGLHHHLPGQVAVHLRHDRGHLFPVLLSAAAPGQLAGKAAGRRPARRQPQLERTPPSIMPTEYVDTYYKRTLSDPNPLSGPAGSTEVCVVGGGLAAVGRAGTGPARPAGHAAGRQPHRLGASGRNGGSVSPAFSAGADAIRRHVDEEHYRALYRLSMEGVEIIRANIRDLDIRDAHKVDGRLRVVRYDAGDALQRWCDEQQRVFERDVRVLSRAQLRERLVTEAYFQGVDDPTSFHFHPLNYARALARDRAAGCAHPRGYAGAGVGAGGRGQAGRHRRRVEARTVVLATGGYTGALQPALRRAMLPIATYIMLTEPLGERVREAIRSDAAIGDDRRAGNYYRVLDGGRIGSVESPPGSTTRPTWPRRCAANCCRFTRNCRACAWPRLVGTHLRAPPDAADRPAGAGRLVLHGLWRAWHEPPPSAAA